MRTMSATSELITIEQASQQAGVPQSTIGYWIVAGTLEAMMMPQGRMVRLADVRRAAGRLDSVVANGRTDSSTSRNSHSAHVAQPHDDTWVVLLNRVADLEREIGRIQSLVAQNAELAKRVTAERERQHAYELAVSNSLAKQAGTVQQHDRTLAEHAASIQEHRLTLGTQARAIERLDGAAATQKESLREVQSVTSRFDAAVMRLEHVLAEHDAAIAELRSKAEAKPVEPVAEAPVPLPPPAAFEAPLVATEAPKPIEPQAPEVVLRFRPAQATPELSTNHVQPIQRPRTAELRASATPDADASRQSPAAKPRWSFWNRPPARDSVRR